MDWPTWNQVLLLVHLAITKEIYVCKHGCWDPVLRKQRYEQCENKFSYLRSYSTGIYPNLLFIFSFKEIKPTSYNNNIEYHQKLHSYIWLDLIARLTPGSERGLVSSFQKLQ